MQHSFHNHPIYAGLATIMILASTIIVKQAADKLMHL